MHAKHQLGFRVDLSYRTRSMTAGLLVFTMSSKLHQGLYSKSVSRVNGPHAIHMEKAVVTSLGGGGGDLIGGN